MTNTRYWIRQIKFTLPRVFWSVAIYLRLWLGTTRSSWSPVRMRVEGCSVSGFCLMLWRGEMPIRLGNSSFTSLHP